MALEAVVFQQDSFDCYCSSKDLYNMSGSGSSWNYVDDFSPEEEGSFDFLANQTENSSYYGDWSSSASSMMQHTNELDHSNPSPEAITINGLTLGEPSTLMVDQSTTIQNTTCPRRRRPKSRKNQEEIENQRMTHIAVERNRRKQMNEYLSVLRSLMPESYVQRGDQASIIGGAINFVKELEQQVQFFSAQTDYDHTNGSNISDHMNPNFMPFSEFFTFPQYSTSSSTTFSDANSSVPVIESSIADIEVSLIESHANIKIRSKKQPKQLIKLVSGLQSLRLSVLHLNVTTFDPFVLYSLSVKVEDDCELSSVDEIATALHQLLGRIQEEALILD